MLTLEVLLMEHILKTRKEEQTLALASFLALFSYKGLVITLDGPLGSGKTTFVKGFAKGLKITERVISPTFNILKCYFHEPLSLYHIDAYRLEDEFIELGLEEYIEGDGVTLIEWPSYIKELIPSDHLSVEIETLTPLSRKFSFKAYGEKAESLILKLRGYKNV